MTNNTLCLVLITMDKKAKSIPSFLSSMSLVAKIVDIMYSWHRGGLVMVMESSFLIKSVVKKVSMQRLECQVTSFYSSLN